MILLRIIGFLWAFPITLLSWIFFFLPHYFKGTFQDVRLSWKYLAFIWDVDNRSSFYKNTMDGWYGFVLGANVCVIDIPEIYQTAVRARYLHEVKGHVTQYFIFGILFFPLYIGHTCYLWLFRKDKHAYLDNFLERWARKVAGQKVDIPREEWPDGYDRWVWW
jgi:hypothetical protein